MAETDIINQRDPIPSDPDDSLYHTNLFLTDAQLEAEIEKCEYCEEKPCRDGCPSDCSPADFIKASEVGNPSDIRRAAALIMTLNPFGGVCGLVCPDKHCMAQCTHKDFDSPVNIPAVQATLIQKAKDMGVMPELDSPPADKEDIAVVGSGPTGMGAAALLSQRGYSVKIFEEADEPGGMCRLIPEFRLAPEVLRSDIEWLMELDNIELELNHPITDPEYLLEEDFAAVVVATGLWNPLYPGIPNEEQGIAGLEFLENPEEFVLGDNVAVVGGGATAYDCAMTAQVQGADRVEMFSLEKLSEMPLTDREMEELTESGIDVNGRIQVDTIHTDGGNEVSGITTRKIKLNADEFSLEALEPIPNTETTRNDIDTVIFAIGANSKMKKVDNKNVFYAGDCIEGPTTVVEGSAAGKNAAEQVDSYLEDESIPTFERAENGCLKSKIEIPGFDYHPVPLKTEFFGIELEHPFLLSAAPPTDGYDQMKQAYEAGWAGGIMKTSFASGPIHIPEHYMFEYDKRTFANCDNVSGHLLDRVCEEVSRLRNEFPDKLTAASTGGPVTGNDSEDKEQWQANTERLEAAGAKLIEYSLSCPQGGEGTEGDIVAQSAELSAKIVDWILQESDPSVPKLFKLTGAVTAIETIVNELKEVFKRYPEQKAGITLANTFPTLAFRKGEKEVWEDGIVAGMSGQGALNISYHSLAKAAPLNVAISGNGGPMNYKAAANFLALGCQTAQFCSMPTAMGYDIVNDLTSGVSHLMAEREIESMDELVGIALPDPIRDFMDLDDEKRISDQDQDLCVQCGNCTRCPYLAIEMDEDDYPETDPELCIGCGMCVKLCPVDAIELRERTAEEAEMLSES